MLEIYSIPPEEYPEYNGDSLLSAKLDYKVLDYVLHIIAQKLDRCGF
jgi:hypothetical protein